MYSIEICFVIDAVRKCFHKKPKSKAIDVYEVFVEYVKSNLIIDLISLVPNIMSGLNPKFTFLKIIRIYEVEMLHFIVA